MRKIKKMINQVTCISTSIQLQQLDDQGDSLKIWQVRIFCALYIYIYIYIYI